MKRILLISLFLLMASTVKAETVFVVQRADGGVSVIYPAKNTKKTMNEIYKDNVKGTELEGRPFLVMDSSALPRREDREYWYLSGVDVEVDQIKKAQDAQAKDSRKQSMDALKAKLKLTDEEFKLLKEMK